MWSWGGGAGRLRGMMSMEQMPLDMARVGAGKAAGSAEKVRVGVASCFDAEPERGEVRARKRELRAWQVFGETFARAVRVGAEVGFARQDGRDDVLHTLAR